MSLKLLPLALSDFAIECNCGITFVPCLNCFLFSFHVNLPILQDSRHVELKYFPGLMVRFMLF